MHFIRPLAYLVQWQVNRNRLFLLNFPVRKFFSITVCEIQSDLFFFGIWYILLQPFIFYRCLHNLARLVIVLSVHYIASTDLDLSPIANHLLRVWFLLDTTIKIVANITYLRRIVTHGHTYIFLVDTIISNIWFIVLHPLLICICLTHGETATFL